MSGTLKVHVGVDLGSTTTKAVVLDTSGEILGRGITNSRSNYALASEIAREEARVSARFALLDRALAADDLLATDADRFRNRLLTLFRQRQHVTQLGRLREVSLAEAHADRVKHIRDGLLGRLRDIFDALERDANAPSIETMLASEKRSSDFFRDRAGSAFSRLAEASGASCSGAGGSSVCGEGKRTHVTFDDLMGIFDKAIIQVENTPIDLTFEGNIRDALDACTHGLPEALRERFRRAVDTVVGRSIEEVRTVGTGYGRQTLPFDRRDVRSEILCHGLGAHRQFPTTRTVLDIGGQDTKAIQVDGSGIVTSFQMNDRCAAGCGRYLGYIADEMSLGVHELGPLAMKSTRRVKISSTCTVFAGAELRDRLSLGDRREDILAGLHRAIILRAMALLARSGGIEETFTFTGGVANNAAAVKALRQLVQENYGERTLNISPGSIYTGALGAALFAQRGEDDEARPGQEVAA